LSVERIRRLDAIGFVWSKKKESIDYMPRVAASLAFAIINANCPMILEATEELSLDNGQSLIADSTDFTWAQAVMSPLAKALEEVLRCVNSPSSSH
jgi:hypothetical protein